ncbi:MAG: c-type cytochrome [Chromatiales bacterium]|nr:c-type cytochrome [Chromatiales bacterium]
MSQYSYLFISGMMLLFGATTVASEAPNPALLYHNYCSVCHGDRGDGQSRATKSLTPPPRNFTSAASQRDLVRPRIIHSITNGRPGTAMSAWSGQLSKEKIAALADYLLSQFINARQTRKSHPGRPIFEKNCSVCHGDKGDGGRWTTGLKFKPRDFTSERGRSLSAENMISAVTQGIAGTPMVSFTGKLSSKQINDVVDYIRIAFMSERPQIEGLSGTRAHGVSTPSPQKKNQNLKATETPSTEMTKSMPNNLIGKISQGRDFYMHNCFTCHGPSGDGKGPRAYFINPKPANFLADRYQQSMNRPALFKGIKYGRLGSEMPAWGKVLSDQQIANVTEFVFQAYIQHNPRAFKDELKKKRR